MATIPPLMGGAMGRDEYVIEAKNISKKYKDLVVLNDVSLQVKKGECLAILGPNGAGKTTTCEILEGLISSDTGDVKICGMSYAENDRKIKSLTGVQLQETVLYKRYTVKETLELFASFYDDALKPEVILQQLGLVDKKDVRLEKLSGGQKQRVYLGTAIVNKPQVVFLDEPTTGLDPRLRREIWDVVEQLKKDDRGILLTTHYMEEAEQLADRIVIFDKGRVVAKGTVEELIKQHGSDEVISVSFKEDSRDVDELFTEISSVLSWFKKAAKHKGKYRIPTTEAGRHVQELMRTCDQLKIEIDSFSMRKGTLEDVFLNLTGRSMIDG